MRLIDADELKQAYFTAIEKSSIGEVSIVDIIDNAPTVEQEVYITGEDYNLYMRGYNQARKDFERPQGEWIDKHITSCGKILQWRANVLEQKCSVCGRYSLKWVETIPSNYCQNCGADMRGDKNENDKR